MSIYNVSFINNKKIFTCIFLQKEKLYEMENNYSFMIHVRIGQMWKIPPDGALKLSPSILH